MRCDMPATRRAPSHRVEVERSEYVAGGQALASLSLPASLAPSLPPLRSAPPLAIKRATGAKRLEARPGASRHVARPNGQGPDWRGEFVTAPDDVREFAAADAQRGRTEPCSCGRGPGRKPGHRDAAPPAVPGRRVSTVHRPRRSGSGRRRG